MGELYFKAELLDDVVLSQRTATVGEHKSLDYIPGSVFLGIAASKFYKEFESENAWKIFHGSKVRFFNAYPVIKGCRTIPMPLSLHSEKVPRVGKEKSVLNFTFPQKKEEGIQYRQSRSGDVIFNDKILNVVVPSKTSRMRTAVDAKTGTAAKSQLYSYESLNAGQSFIGKIEWDDSVADLVTPIVDFFRSKEIVHAGRSKTASYGRVELSEIVPPKNDLNMDNLSGKSFSILAVSDLCLKNPVTGTPEMNLSPDFLGLGNNWKLDRIRYFSRPSILYQYNSKRKEIEIQKTLISKGSVFTFVSDSELTSDEKQKILNAVKNGIGDGKGQGFGEISLFNIGEEFIKEDLDKEAFTVEPNLTADEKMWLEWLRPVFISKNVEDKVKNAVEEFIKLCKTIKSFYSFDDETVFWPGKTQWGRILEVSRTCDSKDDLRNRLFEGENPIIKPITKSQTERNGDTKEKNPDKEWNYESSLNGDTLRKWLMNFVQDDKMSDKDVKIALQQLVKRCKDIIDEKNWLNEGVK